MPSEVSQSPDPPEHNPALAGKFVRDTLSYLIASLLNAALPMLMLPVLTRVLTPADYGIVAMFAVMMSLIGAFTGLSMHGAISVRYFTLSSEALSRFISTCLLTLIATTLTALGLVYVAGPLLVELTGVPLEWLLVAVAISALQMVGHIQLVLWQVRREPFRFALFQVSQTLLNLMASLYLVLIVGLAWEGRLLGQSSTFALFGLAALFLLWRRGYIVLPRDFRCHLSDILRFGIPLVPHVVGGLMIVAVDRLIIAAVIDVAAVGIYMVGLQIAMVLGLLTEAFNKVYAPWLMSHLSSENPTGFTKIVRGTYVYFVGVIAVAMLLGLLAPTIVGLLAGDSFRESQSVILFLALGYAFSGCYLMVTNYIFYANRTVYLAAVTMGSGLVNLGVTYLLVRSQGIVGAAKAFAIAQALSFLATWWLSHRVYPMPWLRALARD